jgi:hypothetical protein
MKKVLLITVFASAALSGCAGMTHTEKCMGGGGIGGALLLGPVGAVAGVVAGHEICKK